MFPSQRKGPSECGREKSMRLRGYTLIFFISRVKECQFEFDRKKNTGINHQTLLRITSFYLQHYSHHPSIFFKEWGIFRSAWVWLKNNRGLSGCALIFFKEPGREGSQTHMCVWPALYLARVCRMNLLPNFCSLNYCQRFILFLSQIFP